jgi:proteasome lid subunit RPN8/RPN11
MVISRMSNKIIKIDLSRTVREAKRAARNDGKEICGLLIHNGHFIELMRTINISENSGKFEFDVKQVRAIKRAADLLGHEIVGTFHSHPVSEARPGPGDIEGAVDDSLMLIVDCMGDEARLWKIKDGQARRMRMEIIQL